MTFWMILRLSSHQCPAIVLRCMKTGTDHFYGLIRDLRTYRFSVFFSFGRDLAFEPQLRRSHSKSIFTMCASLKTALDHTDIIIKIFSTVNIQETLIERQTYTRCRLLNVHPERQLQEDVYSSLFLRRLREKTSHIKKGLPPFGYKNVLVTKTTAYYKYTYVHRRRSKQSIDSVAFAGQAAAAAAPSPAAGQHGKVQI